MRDTKGRFVKGNKENVGSKRSNASRKNISESLKGRHLSKETKEKIRMINIGKKQSPETIEKRVSKLRGGHMTQENKRKLIEANTGRKMSEETKRKIIMSHLGKHHTEEWKKRMSERMSKENHPLWLGGISFEPYSVDWTRTLKKAIKERDKYICQICSNEGTHVHHIDYNKKNCNPDNLITLCLSCHAKTNFNREYWIDYFKLRMEEK
jgi:5-methylcytosine-specific restriction endonuclease McrA